MPTLSDAQISAELSSMQPMACVLHLRQSGPVKVFNSFVVVSASSEAKTSVAQEVHVGSALQLHRRLKVCQGSIRLAHLLQQQPSGVVGQGILGLNGECLLKVSQSFLQPASAQLCGS